MSQEGERPEKPGEAVEDASRTASDDVRAPVVENVDLTREAARQAFDRIMESRARRTKAEP